jgi:hypothetical protein
VKRRSAYQPVLRRPDCSQADLGTPASFRALTGYAFGRHAQISLPRDKRRDRVPSEGRRAHSCRAMAQASPVQVSVLQFFAPFFLQSRICGWGDSPYWIDGPRVQNARPPGRQGTFSQQPLLAEQNCSSRLILWQLRKYFTCAGDFLHA